MDRNLIENGLVPIYEGNFIGTMEKLVDGRELHKVLCIDTNYTTWFNRMCEFGFSENIDFIPILEKSTGGRPEINHAIKIDMAKEIAMIQRSAIGKSVRQYFIDVEKKSKIPMTYREALEAHLEQVKKNESLQQQNKMLSIEIQEKNELIESQNKDLIYLEMIKGSPSALATSQIAADYGCSPQDMNLLLFAEELQKQINGQWLPKGVFAGHRLTVSTTKIRGVGEHKETENKTLFTQKGRYRIYQFLKELGILPEAELADDDTSSYDIIKILVDVGRKMKNNGTRFRTEIPHDIQEKIKIATKHFTENEKIKTELYVDENGEETDMVGFYDADMDEARALVARPWCYKKSDAIRLYNIGVLSEEDLVKKIGECCEG